MQIADRVVAQSVGPVLRRLHDLDAVGAPEFVESVGVADDEAPPAFRMGVPCDRKICASPRLTPAIVGGSPHVKPRRKPSRRV